MAYDHRFLSDRLENSASDSDLETETDQTGLFDYREKVYSAYTILKRSVGRLTWQGGLRFEHLRSNSDGSDDDYEHNNSFTDLFPSIHLSYRINDSHQINGGYSRRVSRPNFRHVNPFSVNPQYSQREGNPNLRPEFGHNLELNYQFLSSSVQWSSSVFYRRKNDIIESNLAIVGNVQTLSYANLGQGNAYGIENRLALSPFTFWDLNIDANYYSQNISTSAYVEFDRPFSSNLNIRNSLNLAGGMKADLNYRRLGSYRTTNQSGEPYGSLDLALRNSYFDKRLNVTVQASDMFNRIERRSASYAENYVQEMLYRRGVNYSRHFSISLAYKIADSSTRKRNRKNRDHGFGGTSE